MDLKLAVLLILGFSYVNATETDSEKTLNSTTNGNLTVIFYKGIRVTAPEGLCERNVCLTKCCPFGAQYDSTSRSCVNSTRLFDPVLYDEYLRKQSDNASDLFYFKVGIIKCNMTVRVQMSNFASRTKKDFFLRTDGHLYVESPLGIPPWFLVSPHNYCIDNFVNGNDIREGDALVCLVKDKNEPHHYLLTATCMLISCLFILLTVGVYVWLPKLHNVHGRVLIAYLTCLFVGFLVLATMQLLLHYNKLKIGSCESMAFIIYFSLLSAFFWLNVMCYDIWRVFSGKREIRPHKLLVWVQIRSYAIYAFGIPTILTILLISLEYSGLPHHPLLPMIRYKGCFISGKSRMLYFYGPILTLCVANFVFFIMTAVKIAITRKETSVLSSRESSRHDQNNDKETLLLYVKLFILMGISWILEIVSALYPSDLWVYSDVYNVLIGLIIFIIFVCKRKTFDLLKERYRGVRRHNASQSTMWTRTTTTRDETALNSSYTQ